MSFITAKIAGIAKTLKVGSDSDDFLYKVRTGTLASGAESVVIDTDKPVMLDYLEWSCDHISDVRLLILAYNKDFPQGVAITRIAGVNGSQLYNSTNPENIANQSSGLWDYLEFHETNNRFKFRLKLDSMEFAKGVKIAIENTGPEDRNASVIMYGREFR